MVTSRWSRWTTTAAVPVLATIVAAVSYSHMYDLAPRHGEPAWRGAVPAVRRWNDRFVLDDAA